jgi:DNA-binding MarR family transcriptional regulator
MTRQDSLRRIEHAILRISRIGTGRAAARIRSERSGVDLSRPAISVLAALNAGNGLRLTELAERTDLEMALVSREVRALEADGYVRRAADPRDGRASRVDLTPKGRRAYESYRQATDEIIAETFTQWTAKDLTALATLLERVATDFATFPVTAENGRRSAAGRTDRVS